MDCWSILVRSKYFNVRIFQIKICCSLNIRKFIKNLYAALFFYHDTLSTIEKYVWSQENKYFFFLINTLIRDHVKILICYINNLSVFILNGNLTFINRKSRIHCCFLERRYTRFWSITLFSIFLIRFLTWFLISWTLSIFCWNFPS